MGRDLIMRSSEVLEMLNKGQIDELKVILQDEVYTESLKSSPNLKKRYAAMKKYFTYIKSAREACQKPNIVYFEGTSYTSFCNSYSLALTIESCGVMEMFDNSNGTYPDTTRVINTDGVSEKVDFGKVFAEARSKGYKLNKKEVIGNSFLMLYDGSYFRIGLLEATYNIINEGGEVTVYHKNKQKNSPITIVNDLGYCVVMPVRYEPEEGDGVTIIEVK